MFDTRLNINGDNLLLFENIKSKENIISAFWEWIDFMDKANFRKAVESIYWGNNKPIAPEDLKERITTFFTIEEKPLEILYPCLELKELIDEAIEIEWIDFQKTEYKDVGWCLLKIPVTNNKIEAKKSTNAGLWAVAASFFIMEFKGKLAFRFEIFQL